MVHSKDKAFQRGLLCTIACRDQNTKGCGVFCFFTLHWSLSQFSEFGCFSLTNWREDSQTDAGDGSERGGFADVKLPFSFEML